MRRIRILVWRFDFSSTILASPGRWVNRTRSCGLLLLAATFLLAENAPSWKTKPVEQWDNEDAKQILAESPWVGNATLQTIRDRSPAERRDGGDWDAGAGPGVGLAVLLEIFTGGRGMDEAIARAHLKPSPGKVDIRWESAMPVRAAESKLGQSPASALHTDWYAITLYDVPHPAKHWDAGKLKGLAYLKRENKRELRPSRVEVAQHGDGRATITYLFSRSKEISRRDSSVIFVAQVDRLFVAQFFYPGTMLIAGQLEL
jgi:hypothetical protein